MKRNFQLRLGGVAVAAASLLCLAAPPASAQVKSVNVGIDTTCPYGLVGCWPGVLDGLIQLDCLSYVQEQVDTTGLLAVVKTKNGRLPDAATLTKSLKKTGEPFSLRGIEIVAEGLISRSGADVMLLLPGEAPIRLVTLKQKIQWDKAKKAFQEPTKAERSAFARLTADVSGKQGRLRITGPLVSEKDGAMRLEVREYEWLPAKVAGK